MRNLSIFLVIAVGRLFSQTSYTRTELPTEVSTPWEIAYGPDDHLWLTEKGGVVSRVDPLTGEKQVVYRASDYFEGHSSECCTNCHKPPIGIGTFGLALHPRFKEAGNSFIYFVYSYNSKADSAYCTKFRIKRLLWDASTLKVIADSNIVNGMPTGYDHWGGRLLAVEQGGKCYLYFTVGDNGISEDNSPGCYVPENSNPNNFAQDPSYLSGKVHRFNMDGSIPAENPLPGNSFFTRGHRNPQGLMYNPEKDILYDVEHGDRTDDEINVLRAGMNYGWKQVRGYHNDDNFKGEMDYIYNYKPHPLIKNDALVEPLFAWSAVTQNTNSNNMFWGTVAPSGGIYYGNDGLAEFRNSLLVVTLKNGNFCDQEMYCFRLAENGVDLAPSTVENPNPKKYFAADQDLNGRLRDLAVSPDGSSIFLVNNGGTKKDKIIVYRFPVENKPAPPAPPSEFFLDVFPNPCNEWLNIRCSENVERLALYNMLGEPKQAITTRAGISMVTLPAGTYYLKLTTASGYQAVRRLVKSQ